MINMNCIRATIVAFIVMFPLGYAIYEPLLGGFFAANAGTATGVIRENPVFWQIIVGQLCGAGLLVTVLSWKGVKSAADGFKGGVTFGVLLSLFYGFMNLGTMNTSTMNAVLVDVVANAVLMGAAGAVAALVLKRG